MAIDGYIIHLDIKQLDDVKRLLSNVAGNVNQIAKRANETGNIYSEDIADVKGQLDCIRTDFGEVLKSLAELE